MAAVERSDCVIMEKSVATKLQECNGKESSTSNGKLGHKNNGYTKNNISNGVGVSTFL